MGMRMMVEVMNVEQISEHRFYIENTTRKVLQAFF
jgi:hypothetical protein